MVNSGRILVLFISDTTESIWPVILTNSNSAINVAKAIVLDVGSENMLATVLAPIYRNTV